MSNCSASLKKSTKAEAFCECTLKIDLEACVISLLKQSSSPSEISRHFCDVGIPGVTPYRDKKILFDRASKIKEINDKFDEIASACVSILEWDETFKGLKYKVLVVLDSITGYVFLIERLLKRDFDHIVAALKPLRKVLQKVQVVLTDGAKYFPKVVKTLCPHAVHQICLVHVMRSVHANLRKLREPYGDAISEVQKLKDKLKTCEKSLAKMRANRKKKRQKLSYHLDKRRRLREKHGAKPGQKGIWKKYPELKANYETINAARSEFRSVWGSIERNLKKKKALKAELKDREANMRSEWAAYMKECKVKIQFYGLFLHREEEYQTKKRAFVEKLKGEPTNSMRDGMLQLLEKVPSLDAINRSGASLALKRNYLNTNAIESFNSKFRRLLESMRNVFDSPYCRARMQLFRLHHNVDRPLHGSRDGLSPIERYGYDLRGRTSVSLVIHGLPPGPQSEIFLPELNANLTARKTVKNAISSQT